MSTLRYTHVDCLKYVCLLRYGFVKTYFLCLVLVCRWGCEIRSFYPVEFVVNSDTLRMISLYMCLVKSAVNRVVKWEIVYND